MCGEHKWAESECKHGPQAEEDESKPPLAKSSKAMEALRKIVLDVKWLKSLHFYVRFRFVLNILYPGFLLISKKKKFKPFHGH